MARAGPLGGMALRRSRTSLCASFRSCRASPLGAERRKCHQGGLAHPPLTAAGRAFQTRQKGPESAHQIGSVCSDGSRWNKGLVFVSAEPPRPVHLPCGTSGWPGRFLTASTVNNEDAGSKQGDDTSHCPHLDTSRQGRLWLKSPRCLGTLTCPGFLVNT